MQTSQDIGWTWCRSASVPPVKRAPYSVCHCILIIHKGTPAQTHGRLNTIGGGIASQRSARGQTSTFATEVAPILVLGRNYVSFTQMKRDALAAVQTSRGRPPPAAVVANGTARAHLRRRQPQTTEANTDELSPSNLDHFSACKAAQNTLTFCSNPPPAATQPREKAPAWEKEGTSSRVQFALVRCVVEDRACVPLFFFLQSSLPSLVCLRWTCLTS